MPSAVAKHPPTRPQELLTELSNAAAFGSRTPLGQPLPCPPRNLPHITADVLSSFVASQYVPSRMVLAAAGYDHDALVSLAETHFGSLPAGAPQSASPVAYVGGEIRESSPDGDEMTHFALSFKVRRGSGHPRTGPRSRAGGACCCAGAPSPHSLAPPTPSATGLHPLALTATEIVSPKPTTTALAHKHHRHRYWLAPRYSRRYRHRLEPVPRPHWRAAPRPPPPLACPFP